MTTIEELKTMVRTQAATLLQALDALGTDPTPAPAPAPVQPPLEWDEQLTQRGVRYIPAPNSPWRLQRGTFRQGEAAQGLHHILIETFDPQIGRVVGVPVRFSWPDGSDARATEAKPGEQFALAWPLYAAGYGYEFTVDGGPRVKGMGLGTIEHPNEGDHVRYEFVFVRGTPATVTPVAEPGEFHG